MKTYTEPARELPVADGEEVVVVGGGGAVFAGFVATSRP